MDPETFQTDRVGAALTLVLDEATRRKWKRGEGGRKRLAAESEVSYETLRHYVERPYRAMPVPTLLQLARGLGLPASVLVARVEAELLALDLDVTSRSAEPAVQSEGKAGWIGPDRRKDHATRARFDELAGTGTHAGEDVDTGSS